MAKLKSLKLKAKDSQQELNAAVAVVLRSEFGKFASTAPAVKTKETSKAVLPEVKIKPKETLEPAAKLKTPIKKEKVKGVIEKKSAKVTVSKVKATPAKAAAVEVKVKSPKVEATPKPAAAQTVKTSIPPSSKPKSKLSTEQFVSVKPLAKKRKRPMEESLVKQPLRDEILIKADILRKEQEGAKIAKYKDDSKRRIIELDDRKRSERKKLASQ